ncbi:MAG TPA: alpha/beta hydrolase [Rhizomicrobium sp.]|nr:alpha/beta hydrolase [Rhizomicrobium sp.]
MRYIFAFLFLVWTGAASAQEEPVYGPLLEGYEYPFPVQHYRFQSQGVAMDMAYLDVAPSNPNGHTIVLLHGKNFCAASWAGTIQVLTAAGYRVIAPDQIGFCKSTKPAHYQYTFEQLAANTHGLLASLGLNRAIVMGHSMGGTLATRYALVYPDSTEQLVSVNPLGLEDGRLKGVPPTGIDRLYQAALKTSADSIRDYQRNVYYAGTWKPDYEPWVQIQAGMLRGPGKEIVAWNSALTSEMIYTQPVVHELEKLKMPVLLLIGDKDTTGRSNAVPPAIRATLGNFPVMAKAAAARIPGAKLVQFPDLGHSPQIQDPAAFHKALLDNLIKP